MLRFLLDLLAPYQVRVYWDAQCFDHRAATIDRAIAWLAQYPTDATVTVRTRSGRLVACRPACY